MVTSRSVQPDDVYSFDGWAVYPHRGLIRRGDTEVHVAPRVMDLLAHLLRRSPAVVSKEELVKEVWNAQAVTDDALSVAVYELRKALGDKARGARWIETVPRRGYRFRGHVELSEPAAGTPKPEPGRRRRWRRPLLRAAAVAAVLVTSAASAVVFLRAPTVSPGSQAEIRALLDRGEVYLQVRSADSLARSEGAFRQALARDATHAEAWAALSRALSYRADLRLGDRLDLYHRARQAAEKALELDPLEPQAHLSLGTVLFLLDWDFDRAGKHLFRSRELLPDDPTVYQVSAWWFSARGDHEAALSAARRALRLDPASATRRADLAFVHLVAGDTDSSLRHANAALVLDPGCASADAVRVRAHLARNAFGAAATAMGAPEAEDSETAFWSFLETWIDGLGPGQALVARAALAGHQGQTEIAIALLERARERRDWEVLWLEHLPELRSLHGEPRFIDLLARRTNG